MIAAELEEHEVVGIDAAHTVCSCGETCRDYLEHLGEVAQDLWGLSPKPVELTPREEVLASPLCDRVDRLIWHAFTDEQIADQLFIPIRVIRRRRKIITDQALAA